MFSNNYFTISDFAKLMGISRQTLIYYDRIDLFKPVKTLGNKYRLYSRSQINVISLITMLSAMGVPLKEIKLIIDRISPDTAIDVLNKQKQKVQEDIRKLRMIESMMDLRIEQISLGNRVLQENVPEISIVELNKEIPLYIGKAIDCVWDEITDDMIIEFYSECEKQGFPLIFSYGQMKSMENLLSGQTDLISNMCFVLKDYAKANAVIPKGKYVVSYAYGDYGDIKDIYNKILSYINEQNLKIAGNAYEEYLIDELAESHSDRFVMKIMVETTENEDVTYAIRT